eukprot:SAG31_NODE_2751_length_5144_cov_2.392666_5_plen_93_part_00
MPTLLEEAGLPVPTCPTSQKASRATVLCTEGRSLSKLLRGPSSVVHACVLSRCVFHRHLLTFISNRQIQLGLSLPAFPPRTLSFRGRSIQVV